MYTYRYRLANASEAVKQAVWAKGVVIPGYDPGMWRYDICGAVIRYGDHGDRSSEHGWEIDHIVPLSQGGSDHITNLQPLHWENNAAKGDSRNVVCVVPRR